MKLPRDFNVSSIYTGNVAVKVLLCKAYQCSLNTKIYVAYSKMNLYEAKIASLLPRSVGTKPKFSYIQCKSFQISRNFILQKREGFDYIIMETLT